MLAGKITAIGEVPEDNGSPHPGEGKVPARHGIPGCTAMVHDRADRSPAMEALGNPVHGVPLPFSPIRIFGTRLNSFVLNRTT